MAENIGKVKIVLDDAQRKEINDAMEALEKRIESLGYLGELARDNSGEVLAVAAGLAKVVDLHDVRLKVLEDRADAMTKDLEEFTYPGRPRCANWYTNEKPGT